MAIVLGILMSHAPGITGKPHLVDAKRWESLKKFEEGRIHVEAAAPDLIVAFVNDHFQNFFLDGMPPFCFGIGEEHVIPDPELAHIVGLKPRCFPGDPEIANGLLQYVMQSGFDPAYSEELRFVDELGVPLSFLMPDHNATPIVPIMINCVAPPLPSWKRCMELGVAIGNGLEKLARNRRVLILGSGGLAHWVGTPETGRTNPDFDQKVLNMIQAGEGHQLASWNDDQIFCEAGNGAFELRTWAAALGIIRNYRSEILGYATAPEWLTGMGAMVLHVG